MFVNLKQKGNVMLNQNHFHDGQKRTNRLILTKVLYIPEAALNILSSSQLDNTGISSKFDSGNCLLIDKRESNCVTDYTSPLECKGLLLTLGPRTLLNITHSVH